MRLGSQMMTRPRGEREWIGGLFHQVCMMRCGFPPAPNCGRGKVKVLKHISRFISNVVLDLISNSEIRHSAQGKILSVARVSTLFHRGCETAEGRTSSIFCSHLRVMFTFLLSSNWYLFCSYCYSSGTVTSDKSIIITTKSGLFE